MGLIGANRDISHIGSEELILVEKRQEVAYSRLSRMLATEVVSDWLQVGCNWYERPHMSLDGQRAKSLLEQKMSLFFAFDLSFLYVSQHMKLLYHSFLHFPSHLVSADQWCL